MQKVLVVDVANVMGSRPDGWWRDRAGAALRLYEQLAAADLPHEEVVLVVEGKAKQGVPAGREGHLRAVHAPGSGDDAIVEVTAAQVAAGRSVTAVTADRALRARLEVAGADIKNPSWLLARL